MEKSMKIFYCILWIFAINFNSCTTVDSKEAKAIRARETEEQVIRWHRASIENSEFAPQTLKLPSFLRSRSGGAGIRDNSIIGGIGNRTGTQKP